MGRREHLLVRFKTLIPIEPGRLTARGRRPEFKELRKQWRKSKNDGADPERLVQKRA
jgi:hypothetical protein